MSSAVIQPDKHTRQIGNGDQVRIAIMINVNDYLANSSLGKSRVAVQRPRRETGSHRTLDGGRGT
jgi:hypothetical protein